MVNLSKDKWHYNLVDSVFKRPSQYSLVYILQVPLCGIIWPGFLLAYITIGVVVKCFPEINWKGNYEH